MPPHLQLTLLNVPPAMDATASLPRPQHVILNHLYIQRSSQNANALVVGTTHRSALLSGQRSGVSAGFWLSAAAGRRGLRRRIGSMKAARHGQLGTCWLGGRSAGLRS